ncbi:MULTISPECIES: segregation/condensation protein A [unclassified Lactococcus]|uniref:segregation/condensation protein A n=1 Tax=unclassified Lactococcus TaxID=2643510 RepID=UPI0011C92835|nr:MULTISPECIES: segregation/condensation protein A [unclassified Lactococcus]MQW23332.1 segregation/condensation protein A [Lactococcus sp. dk101]TXK37966.1 segregation/condensation protein A [Lactococcus sp. dk310]TXK49620.1 segregation/condensation protein A [Lactococcus sp. dk322]
MTNEIKIKINDFEGPLDLLLHLVSQYELDVFQVPLVPVIEQYLAYIKASQNLELEIAGEYMVMASQLMLIKSRRLLPAVTDHFEEDTAQLEYDILAQIDEYRKYKLLSEDLAELHQERSHFYSKSKTELMTEDMTLLKDKTSVDLFLAFNKILEMHKQKVQDENTTIEAEKYTVADKILELSKKFKRRKSYRFSQLFKASAPKTELLTTFLALLELIKNQQLDFTQESLFGEIILERRGKQIE